MVLQTMFTLCWIVLLFYGMWNFLVEITEDLMNAEENLDPDSDPDYTPVESRFNLRFRKRNRKQKAVAVVFSPNEITLLLHEYTKHKVLLNRNTRTKPEVRQLWDSIAEKVSRVQGVHRTSDQCYKKVRNIEYASTQKEAFQIQSES